MPHPLPSPAQATTRISTLTAWLCCLNSSSIHGKAFNSNQGRLANIDTAPDHDDDLLDEQAHTISDRGNALDDHVRRLSMHKEQWESYQKK
jgi:hypothetical protein